MVNAFVFVALLALVSALWYSSPKRRKVRRKVRRAARRHGLLRPSR